MFSPSGELIPNRSSFLLGSQFIASQMNVKGQAREAAVLHELLAGNIPDFLRNFKPLTITEGSNSITYLVMSDYLSIGNEGDYIRMPMQAKTAQIVADKYDCSLPTRKMVNDIFSHAEIKVPAKPWGPPYSDMDNSARYPVQNEKINKQLIGLDKTALLAGHFKDIVLTNKLAPNNPNKKVAIYGWMMAGASKPIQDLNTSSHNVDYTDYSQCIRLISNDVIVNGNLMRLQDVFQNSKYCSLVSDEGILKFMKY